MRAARMTVSPNRSPSSSIGWPALRPTRTWRGSAGGPVAPPAGGGPGRPFPPLVEEGDNGVGYRLRIAHAGVVDLPFEGHEPRVRYAGGDVLGGGKRNGQIAGAVKDEGGSLDGRGQGREGREPLNARRP